MLVKLTDVLLGFNDLWTPTAGEEGGTKKYKADFIIVPNSANAKLVEEAIAAGAKESWQEKAAQMLKTVPDLKNAFKKSPRVSTKTGDVYAGYEGMWSVRASNALRPTLIDANTTPLQEQDGKLYRGCYVDASIDISAYTHQKGFGNFISAKLRWVQFRRDGDRFGTASVPVSQDELVSLDAGADDLV